jgi:hypothetical protein
MPSLLVLNRVYRLEIQSVLLVFRPSFVNYAPITFCLVHPPPLPKVENQYIQRLCG